MGERLRKSVWRQRFLNTPGFPWSRPHFKQGLSKPIVDPNEPVLRPLEVFWSELLSPEGLLPEEGKACDDVWRRLDLENDSQDLWSFILDGLSSLPPSWSKEQDLSLRTSEERRRVSFGEVLVCFAVLSFVSFFVSFCDLDLLPMRMLAIMLSSKSRAPRAQLRAQGFESK